MNRCVACKNQGLEDAIVEERFKVAGVAFAAEVPATRCTQCGETYLDCETMARLDRSVTSAFANHGVLNAESFRRLRRATRLTPTELASILDVRPDVVEAWESGKEPIDRKTAALLAIMVLDRFDGRTTALDRLRAGMNPAPWPDVTRILRQVVGFDAVEHSEDDESGPRPVCPTEREVEERVA